MDTLDICNYVFDLEIKELEKVKDKIGNEIEEAINLIYYSKGRVVVTGVGKSAIIGKKIASSLASTGTKSIFIHASDALHGDLGMISRDDVVIAISNSGSSQEIIDMLPTIKKIGAKIISMTGKKNSPLGKAGDIILDIGIGSEACPLGLAPTSSTTATLVMGDALTVALMIKRNFKPENFALFHPGGALGRKLLTKVKDIMNTDIPKVYEDTNIKEIIYEVSHKRFGMTLVFDKNDNAMGIITDGDIRRRLFSDFNDIKGVIANDLVNRDYKTINENEIANCVLEKLTDNNITCLVVKNDSEIVTGLVTIHDIFKYKN